jgi:hypothetical protein
VRTVALAVVWILAVPAVPAAAQDLFELEVFPYETTPAGKYDVAFHTNVMTRGGVTAVSPVGNHRPVHLSVEATRGWTDRFETALFIQSAPFGSSGSARFAGGHLRSKIRVGELDAFPLRFAASAEYSFNHSAFDRELQTLEVRPIVEYVRGRLTLVGNPSLEIVTRGSEDGPEPVFDVSASAAWRVLSRLALTADYFSAAATTRHLQPESDAHHLMFGGVDLSLASGLDLSVSAGHCITGREPWLVKAIIGFGF